MPVEADTAGAGWHRRRAWNGLILSLVDFQPASSRATAFIGQKIVPLAILLAEFIQLFVFFAPSPPPADLPSLRVITSVFTFSFADLIGMDGQYWLFVGSIALVALGVALAFAVMFQFWSGRPRAHPVLTLGLRGIGLFVAFVAYMPLMMVFVNGILCASYQCWGAVNVSNIVLAGAVGIPSLLFLAFVAVPNLYPADPLSGYLNGRPHARNDVINVLLRTLVPLNSALVAPLSADAAVVVNAVVAIAFVTVFQGMQPFYSRLTNVIKAGLLWAAMGVAIFTLVGMGAGPAVSQSSVGLLGSLLAAVVGAVLVLAGVGPSDTLNALIERLLLPFTVGYEAAQVRALALVQTLSSPMRLGHYASYVSAAWGQNDTAERLWRLALSRQGGGGGGQDAQHAIDYAIWCRSTASEVSASSVAAAVQHLMETGSPGSAEGIVVIAPVPESQFSPWPALAWRRRIRRSCTWLVGADADVSSSAVPFGLLRRAVWSLLGDEQLGLKHNAMWRRFVNSSNSSIRSWSETMLTALLCGLPVVSASRGKSSSPPPTGPDSLSPPSRRTASESDSGLFAPGNWAQSGWKGAWQGNNGAEQTQLLAIATEEEEAVAEVLEKLFLWLSAGECAASGASGTAMNAASNKYRPARDIEASEEEKKPSRVPVAVVLSGLHSADPHSLRVLQRLVGLAARAPVSFFLTGAAGAWTDRIGTVVPETALWSVEEGELVRAGGPGCVVCATVRPGYSFESVTHKGGQSCVDGLVSRLEERARNGEDGESALKLLRIAAALGHSAPVAVLERVWVSEGGTAGGSGSGGGGKSGRVHPSSSLRFGTALSALVSGGVLLIDWAADDEWNWFHFHHRLVRSAMAQSMHKDDTRRINATAITAYAALRSSLPFYTATLLVKHLRAASDGDGLAATLAELSRTEAKRQAKAAAADAREAISLLESRQSVSDAVVRECVELLNVLGESATFSSRPEAWSAVEKATDLLRKRAQTDSSTWTRDMSVHIGAIRAGLHIAESSFAEAEAEARKALAAGSSQYRRSALFNLARALRFQEDRGAEALVAYHQVASAARRAGDVRMQAMAVAGLATLQRGQGRHEKADTHFRLAAFLFRVLGNELMALDTAEGAGMNLLLAGKVKKGVESITEAAVGMARLGVGRAVLHTGTHMMDAALLIGNELLVGRALRLMRPFLPALTYEAEIAVRKALWIIAGQLGAQAGPALARPPEPLPLQSMPEALDALRAAYDLFSRSGKGLVGAVVASQRVAARVRVQSQGGAMASRRIGIAFLSACVVLRGLSETLSEATAPALRRAALSVWLRDSESGVPLQARGRVSVAELRTWLASHSADIEQMAADRLVVPESAGSVYRILSFEEMCRTRADDSDEELITQLLG